MTSASADPWPLRFTDWRRSERRDEMPAIKGYFPAVDTPQQATGFARNRTRWGACRRRDEIEALLPSEDGHLIFEVVQLARFDWRVIPYVLEDADA